MAFLYITEQGSVLRKSSEHLIVKKDDKILTETPAADVEHVMIFGNIQVTTPALRLMAKKNIEVAFLSRSGRLLLQLTPPWARNIFLRKAQYASQQDSAFCLEFSRSIVKAKLTNGLIVIRNHIKNHPHRDCARELDTIEKMLAKIPEAGAIETLLGLEGTASVAYFKALGKMLQPPWQFSGRFRRPPRDPVNAILSFGYVIVGNEIQSFLDGVGFDPYLGFYHATAYGRPSLALDLLEEFRHSLVDRLTLHLFNQNILKTENFLSSVRRGTYLDQEGQKKFFRAYNRYAGEYNLESRSGTVGSFRQIFKEQAHKLANAITKNEPYIPFLLSKTE